MTGSTAIDVRQLINQRPLGAYQKLIVFLCFCIIALDGMDIAIMGFIAPSLKAAWGIGNAELAVVISAALIGLAVGAMVSGPLADWRGRKTIIIASVFLFGLWTLLTAFSQNLQHMVIFRFLTGLGLGAAMPNVGTLVSEFAPEKKRSFIITVVFCGFSFGAASGGFAASWMIPQWGWHSVLLMGGILPLLLVPFLLLKLPESVRFLVSKRADSRQIHPIVDKIAPGVTQADSLFAMPVAEKPPAFAVRLVLSRSYRFGSIMLWGGYFFGLFMVYLLGSWLPTVIKEAGMSVTEATIITALYQAGGTFGSLFAGWLMDKVNPHLALGVIYAAGGAATAMIGVTHAHFVLLAIVAFSSGFCLNGANTGMNALSARYYPTEARATGSGWMHGIGRLGAIMSAFAGAQVVSMGWGLSVMFTILAIPALLTSLMILAKGQFGYSRPAIAEPSY
ncbi:MFS transporter [Dickeya chrysanthemi]|uniref:Aromatic acid/H+ symport family MFS transporter n=1 Tax=Dickeya chrysanthemi TaxID=556 RepID=A0ABU8JTA4_DICCH|nr:aromatic acid/H+ symport family MFS transporter [Dickeya chrysanthemi]MBX9444173.1 aromatic acid/H+ symport family MFS transporter [Dickeya chrysanthemi]MCA7009630.1 aromatic acid/H+ symport family MFS transporter [Dickeya chrysanthemi]